MSGGIYRMNRTNASVGRINTGWRVAAPWWLAGGIDPADCVAAYQAKGAADLAASYVNLTGDATYNIIAGNAPAWTTENGWYGDGTKYLRTGIIPGYNWTTIVRYKDRPTGKRPAFYGCTPFYLIRESGVIEYYVGGIGLPSAAPSGTAGTYGVRDSKGYKDGVYDGVTITGTSNATVEMYILAWNNNGTLAGQLIGYVMALATYNTVLSEAQYLAVHNEMMAL